jgi:hypothetical protein
LASEDPELIECAAVHCQALERDGLKLLKRHEEANKRRNGGKRTGEAQTAKAKQRYAPYLPRYRELLQKGKSSNNAVHIIYQELSERGIDVSTRTLRGWLKKLEAS